MRPNVVVFLTDDQGYDDLSCMGSPHVKTPHLDELAAKGILFNSFYANSPVCSPSRAALLTGKYPARVGIRSILGGDRRTSGMMPGVPTIASHFSRLGYETGLVGKWHLGVKEGSRPDDYGFGYWFGFLAGCIDYYSHTFYWQPLKNHDLWENGEEVFLEGEYFTHLITDKSLAFIRKARAKEAPFFLYVPYNTPHYPMHAPRKYMDRFAHLPWDKQVMAAMLSAMDDSVGEICDELKRQGSFENTLIFFMSDNGASREARNWWDGRDEPYYGGSTGGLRGSKFSLFEGGIRVPAIMHWPERLKPQVCIDPCAAIDILPTLLSAVGQTVLVDGCDLLPRLTGGHLPQRDLYWEYEKQTAVRQESWKLVLDGYILDEATPDAVHLCNLDQYPNEDYNQAPEYPDITQALIRKALEWRESLGA